MYKPAWCDVWSPLTLGKLAIEGQQQSGACLVLTGESSAPVNVTSSLMKGVVDYKPPTSSLSEHKRLFHAFPWSSWRVHRNRCSLKAAKWVYRLLTSTGQKTSTDLLNPWVLHSPHVTDNILAMCTFLWSRGCVDDSPTTLLTSHMTYASLFLLASHQQHLQYCRAFSPILHWIQLRPLGPAHGK